MYDFPTDLRYSEDHLWVRPAAGADVMRVGLTDFAQQSLGDVVILNAPREGDVITAGTACGDVESTKSDNELIAPLTGTVRSHNASLDENPEAVNSPTRTAKAGCSRSRWSPLRSPSSSAACWTPTTISDW